MKGFGTKSFWVQWERTKTGLRIEFLCPVHTYVIALRRNERDNW
jgi:hypothetical protein